MTQEEKHLLIKDLSARLLYGVQAKVDGHSNPLRILGIEKLNKGTWAWRKGTYVVSFWNDTKCIDQVKPYLRPMSSMTEEEREEYEMLQVYPGFKTNHTDLTDMYDFLNAHHFDYRGLIEKGLALEAKEGMYDIK